MAQTRFDKWIAGQSRVDIICEYYLECEKCILFPICDKYRDYCEKPKKFYEECEAYLDEEVEEE